MTALFTKSKRLTQQVLHTVFRNTSKRAKDFFYINREQFDGMQQSRDPLRTMLLANLPIPNLIDNKEWFIERTNYMFDEMTMYGKMIRSALYVGVHSQIVNNLDDKQRQAMFHVGWSIEMLNSMLCTLDDLIDQSSTRRGRKVWHKVIEEKGMSVRCVLPHDLELMKWMILTIIRAHFSNHRNFVKILQMYDQSIISYTYSAMLDSQLSKMAQQFNLTKYNFDMWQRLKICSTSVYSFRTPLQLPFLIVALDEQINVQATLDAMSKYGDTLTCCLSTWDDYEDVYGDEKNAGKPLLGDIKTGRLTWMFAKAIELGNDW